MDKEKLSCLADIEFKYKADVKEKKTEISKMNLKFEGYIAFVHSVLSSSELFVLFYNSLLFPKAKELYVQYHLFDNLLQENLIKKEHANLMDGATLKTEMDLFSKIIKRIENANVENV